MKIEKLIVTFLVALPVVFSTKAQSTFQNLNFEEADLSPTVGLYGGEVPISSALPGWSASIGGVAVTQVLQNNYDLGAASVDIFGPNWNSINPGIIDGNYTVFLQSGVIPPNDDIGVNTSIWQDGTLPANAQSLQFSAWNWTPASTIFTVSFDGHTLSPVVLSSGQSPAGQGYTVYGVNITPYEGQTGQLEFTSAFNNAGPSWTELDDIGFSTNTVTPEPSTLALLVMSGMAFGVRRWRVKRGIGVERKQR
jgi:hypothetical protein